MTIKERIQEIEASGGRVQRNTVSLRDIMRRGVVITVSVHGSGIFNKRLKLAELGIDAHHDRGAHGRGQ